MKISAIISTIPLLAMSHFPAHDGHVRLPAIGANIFRSPFHFNSLF